MWSMQVLPKLLKRPFHLSVSVMQRASKAAFLNFYHFTLKHNQFSYVHLCTVFKRFGWLVVCKHLGNLASDLGLRVFQLLQSLYVHKSQIDSMMSKILALKGAIPSAAKLCVLVVPKDRALVVCLGDICMQYFGPIRRLPSGIL